MIRPSDLCMFVTDDAGQVVAVEHVAPCADGHKTGTVTSFLSGRVVSHLARTEK